MPPDAGVAVRKTDFPRNVIGTGIEPDEMIARAERSRGSGPRASWSKAMHVGPQTDVSVSAPVRSGSVSKACCSHSDVMAFIVMATIANKLAHAAAFFDVENFQHENAAVRAEENVRSPARFRAGRENCFAACRNFSAKARRPNSPSKNFAAARENVTHGQTAAEVENLRITNWLCGRSPRLR